MAGLPCIERSPGVFRSAGVSPAFLRYGEAKTIAGKMPALRKTGVVCRNDGCAPPINSALNKNVGSCE
jgi:hypothetical protein